MSPWIVRNVLFPVHERLLGKPTRRFLRELQESQWWPAARLREFQMEKLRRQLAFVEKEVPYFGRLFAEHGIQASQIQTFADFRRVPLMDKQIIRANLDDLMPRNWKGRTVAVATGGSSGEPLQLRNDMNRIAMQDAARHRVYGWYDVRVGDREVALWGSPADLAKIDRVRKLRDRLLNQPLLSAFGLDEERMDKYIAFLRRYRPAKIYSYASVAYVMALRIQHTGAVMSKRLRCLVTTAEPLYDFQREVIESAFRTRVCVEYGCRDGGLIAGQCPMGGIHLHSELNIVEIAPPGAAKSDDGAGELVMTNLDSYVVPIIRYRTGDLVVPTMTACPCGRELPLLKSIRGRSTDFLVAPDGKLIHALAVIYAVRTVPGVEQFQVHQDAVDHVEVRLQTGGAFAQSSIEQIREGIARVFHDQVKVDVRLVEHMERSETGKFRYVTSAVHSSLTGPPADAQAPHPGGSETRKRDHESTKGRKHETN